MIDDCKTYILYETAYSLTRSKIMEKKRYSVLIVDDEFRIGTLIKKLVHWSELHLECLAVLDDGEKAVQMIHEKNPDIVITDIRMPRVSGLDLIRITSEDNKMNTHFIVISGYKEFEYAHQALAYGVENYILKPVNEVELNDSLKKILQKLNTQNDFELKKREFQETVVKSNKIIRQDFLKNIIDQKESSAVQNTSVDMAGEIYRGIDIKLDHVDITGIDIRQDSKTAEHVIALVDNAMKKNVQEFLICEKEYMHIYCLFNYDTEQSREIKTLINHILNIVKDFLMGFDQYEVTIGIGSEQNSFDKIRFSILEAYRAVCNRIHYGVGRLIYSEDVSPDTDSEIKKRFEDKKEHLYNSIDNYSGQNLKNQIMEIFGNSPQKNTDATEYYGIAEKIVDLFFSHLSQENTAERKTMLLNKCQNCYTFNQLTNVLSDTMKYYLDLLQENQKTKSIRPIRQAKEYVESHFQDKILLEDIAAIVDLNPVYFSTLFKKETNMNFSTYLINVRMEQAKKMLVSSNDTIAAIGDAVGYGDQKYFSQLFKKVVGVKPAIYRRLHS